MSLLRNADNRRLVAVKTGVARALTSRPVGGAINRLTGGVVPAYGMRVDTRSPAVNDEVRAQLLWRLYEGAEVRMVRRHLRGTQCIVDLGASLGVLGSVACRAAGGQVCYLGVEANPELLTTARRNLRVNAPHAAAKIVHGAIDYSRPTGSVAVFDAGGTHIGAALAPDTAAEHFVAPTVRLGELIAVESVDSFTLLMDIEGAEAGLFLEDRESLANCDQMIVEVHDSRFGGTSYTRADVLELALACGFAVAASYGSVHVLERERSTHQNGTP